MNTNDEIFKLYESIDKNGQLAVYRLERYGQGSRFGSKFGGAVIKYGLYQSAGIYVFSGLNRLKKYINDPVNDDSDKSNKGKLCQKIILDRNEIKYPKIQFDIEVTLNTEFIGQINPFAKLIAEYATKNMNRINEEGITIEGKQRFLKPGFEYNGCPGLKFSLVDNSHSFGINFGRGDTKARQWEAAEALIQRLVNIDPSFVVAYNDMMLNSLINDYGLAYKITDTSIIKNTYYFYADKL